MIERESFVMGGTAYEKTGGRPLLTRSYDMGAYDWRVEAFGSREAYYEKIAVEARLQ